MCGVEFGPSHWPHSYTCHNDPCYFADYYALRLQEAIKKGLERTHDRLERIKREL